MNDRIAHNNAYDSSYYKAVNRLSQDVQAEYDIEQVRATAGPTDPYPKHYPID